MKKNWHGAINWLICIVAVVFMSGCANMEELGTNVMNGIDIGLGAVNKGLRTLNDSMADVTGQRQSTPVSVNTQTNNVESATEKTVDTDSWSDGDTLAAPSEVLTPANGNASATSKNSDTWADGETLAPPSDTLSPANNNAASKQSSAKNGDSLNDGDTLAPPNNPLSTTNGETVTKPASAKESDTLNDGDTLMPPANSNANNAPVKKSTVPAKESDTLNDGDTLAPPSKTPSNNNVTPKPVSAKEE